VKPIESSEPARAREIGVTIMSLRMAFDGSHLRILPSVRGRTGLIAGLLQVRMLDRSMAPLTALARPVVIKWNA